MDSRPKRYRLLLLEDNAADADLAAEQLLEVPGFEFEMTRATSLAEAVKLIQEIEFDAALVDLNLPDSVGLETLRHVRRQGLDIAIVVLSGLITEELRLASLSEGAEDVIGKDESRTMLLGRSILYAVERHRAAQQRLQFERMVAHNPDANIVAGRLGTVLFVNDAAVELFGKEREQLMGAPISFVTDAGKPNEITILRGTEKRTGEIRLATIKWAGETAQLAAIRDVTDQKRLEERLRQSQKMEAVGELAGGVAHDFNNLLNVINGNLDLYLADPSSCTDLPEMMAEVRDAGEKAAALTRQLLQFSRKSMISLRPMDLNTLISGMKKILARLIGEHIELTVVEAPNLSLVSIDPVLIDQVILNLSVNSRDAMPRGGKIVIETQNLSVESPQDFQRTILHPGHYVLLTFSDNGVGMDAATRERIFEPFFTTKELGRGTGLGLATVYGIVKQVGGHISVYSEPNKGTSFKIYLPAVTENGVPIAIDSQLPELPGGSETILVVEDQVGLLKLTVRILSSSGYRVLNADGPEAAIRFATEHEGTIHLLLTDVLMPVMTGPAVAEAVTGLRPDIKVLYMSGYADDAVVRFGVLTSAVAFLPKPFSPDALLRRVREVLGPPSPAPE